MKKILHLLPIIVLGLSGCTIIEYSGSEQTSTKSESEVVVSEVSETSQTESVSSSSQTESVPSSSQTPESGDWPAAFKSIMNTILGTTFPFVQLDTATWTCVSFPSSGEGADDTVQVYDDCETDLLTGYDQVLLSNGYTYDSNFDEYSKPLQGTSILCLSFWHSPGYEATESTEAELPGNVIEAYLWDTTWDA